MRPELPSPRAHRPWTTAEDAELSFLWDEGLHVTRIAARLARTRMAIYTRAKLLGLPLGVPRGFESLDAAARRAGVHPRTMRRILRWAGKKIRRKLSEPLPRSFHRLMVDQLDVDEAVAAWTRTEPVEAAARRLGIDPVRLRARLRKVGIQGKGRGRALRITPEQLAAANAIAQWGKRRLLPARRAA